MSLKNRIKKLEQETGTDFVVVMPRYEDADGSEITDATLPATVAASRFKAQGEDFRIERQFDGMQNGEPKWTETPREFEQRVHKVVRCQFKQCVVLSHWVRGL